MDGHRMTGPEPWMASTDDAMEVVDQATNLAGK
jgi:hypothetical protein